MKSFFFRGLVLALEELSHGKQRWFLSDADAMKFMASVTDLADDEELRPGKTRLLSTAPPRPLRPLGEIERRCLPAACAAAPAFTASESARRRPPLEGAK